MPHLRRWNFSKKGGDLFRIVSRAKRRKEGVVVMERGRRKSVYSKVSLLAVVCASSSEPEIRASPEVDKVKEEEEEDLFISPQEHQTLSSPPPPLWNGQRPFGKEKKKMAEETRRKNSSLKKSVLERPSIFEGFLAHTHTHTHVRRRQLLQSPVPIRSNG